MSSLVVVSDE
jgi:hypothetical protein